MKATQISAPGYYWRFGLGEPALVLVEEVAITGNLVMCYHGSLNLDDDFGMLEGNYVGPLEVPSERA